MCTSREALESFHGWLVLLGWRGRGLHIVTSEGDEHNYNIKLVFKSTNNEAKYEALLSGLAVARSLGVIEIEV